jgi:hypothetical protein
MEKDFTTIYENYLNRNSLGGFLPGDYVKLKADCLKDPSVKAGNQQYQDFLAALLAKQDKIRIKLANINTQTPSVSHAPHSVPSLLTGDIGEEIGMGMVPSKITVPLCCLEVDLEAWNRVPESWKARSYEAPPKKSANPPKGEKLDK